MYGNGCGRLAMAKTIYITIYVLYTGLCMDMGAVVLPWPWRLQMGLDACADGCVHGHAHARDLSVHMSMYVYIIVCISMCLYHGLWAYL